MNERDWAWIAGFFEGEGSCGCYFSERRKGPVYKLQASISQKERQVLDHIKSLVGIGSVAPNKGSYGVMWHWRVDSAGARAFLHAIQPYLRSDKKKDQVAKALFEDSQRVKPRNTRRTEPLEWQTSNQPLTLCSNTKVA